MAGKELHGAIRDFGYVGSSNGKGLATDGGFQRNKVLVSGFRLSISSFYHASPRDHKVCLLLQMFQIWP